MREKFKKGEIVSATRTFNGEIITGEFQGYHLFNDEIPDTVVGIVDVPGDGVYDVDVTSIRHYESEDEKIRKELVEKISNLACGCFISQEQKQKFIAYLEKQKEQKPILEVFGFKVGDAVRLKDGDGRKHIIKSFEEVEGVHGPNFYHVEFEDNSARDGIYPGEEYPNGYYTQMEKFEEEQKPTATINGEPIPTENHSVDIPLAEWSEEDMDYYDTIVRKLEVIGDDSGLSSNQIKFLREHCPSRRSEWSEEDMTKLRDVVRMIEDSGHVKSIREHYERFLNSLPERFNLQPKQEWSSEKPMDGLEEEMDKFFETMTVLEHENIFEDTFKNIARHFAQWQKSQMMKEAVEGEYDFYPAAVYLDVPIPRMNHGDKVRVIVIPNTDEK